MIAAMRAAVAVGLVFGFAACACNRDEDAQKLVDELGSFDDTVEATVRASPNEEGLAKAEALVEAKRGSLHQRVVAMKDADLSTAATQAMSNACVKNQQNGKIIQGYVMNAVLKTNPALVARATKLADSLCEICVTGPSDAWMCVNFKEQAPVKYKSATD